jgi:acyl-CoA thioesterase
VQPAKGGTRLLAAGHAYHRSGTMSFCEAEVLDTDNRLIAKAMGIFKFQKLETR